MPGTTDRVADPAVGAPPLLRHAGALALLLVVLLPVVGWHGVFSSDEGAALAQARSLSDDGTYGIPHPFPEADPDRVAFPLEKSAPSGDGWAPLPKKPAYPALLAGIDELAGRPGMLLLSISGSVVAALLAGRLAQRIGGSLGPLTLWVTGIASPLLVDSYLLIAHALAAALAAASVLAALRAVERPSARRIAPVVLLVTSLVLLRAEGALLGAALAASLGAVGLVRRSQPMAWAAGAVLTGSVAGWVLDRALTSDIISGSSLPRPSGATGSDGTGLLEGRWRGFLETWLRPGYGELGTTSLLLITIVLTGLLGVRELRRARPDDRAVRAIAGVVGGAAVVLLVTASVPGPHIVPGLVVAFPVGVWGLASLHRSTLQAPTAQVLAVTGALFAVGVLASQYAIGGAWEWGGRYFAVGLPVVTPLVAAGLHEARNRLDRETRSVVTAAVVAATVTISAVGLGSVRYFRDGWRDFVATVDEQAAATEPGDGGAPVVVTTEPDLPRAAWDELSDGRWLLVSSNTFPTTLDRLDQLGIEELVVVTKGPAVPRLLDRSSYVAEGNLTDPGEGEWWIGTATAR